VGGHSGGGISSESKAIHCNLTLLFSFRPGGCLRPRPGVTLISPFRRPRIYDWYKKENGGAEIAADKDPGVCVRHVYLQLLQEIRLQNPGNGRQFSEM